MGRIHPHYCKHDKMIDSGSFDFEPEGCRICEAQAAEYNRRATTGYDELQSQIVSLKDENAAMAHDIDRIYERDTLQVNEIESLRIRLDRAQAYLVEAYLKDGLPLSEATALANNAIRPIDEEGLTPERRKVLEHPSAHREFITDAGHCTPGCPACIELGRRWKPY